VSVGEAQACRLGYYLKENLNMSFETLNLIEPIGKALQNEGYQQPTPIQEQAIPVILEKKDVLGCARTGTGKTAAFAIPILQMIYQAKGKAPQTSNITALVLTPTRELAIQIGESFAAYGTYTGLRHTVIFGGVSQKSQTDALQNGVDILVATPGRLLDLAGQKLVNLRRIQMFVLDEADRMLDMGFIHDVKKIIALLPVRKQTLFFSATMPPEIAGLADSILTNPVKIAVDPVSSPVEVIEQAVFFVGKEDKKLLLLDLLKGKAIVSALVFTRTKYGADKVARFLTKAGVRAEAIHGGKSQTARQRALNNFKARQTRVLVATDIAARGIDVEELSHVINFDLPNVPETYVHRIGRTGRAGMGGVALSFCDQEEKAYLKDIQKLIGKFITVINDHPYPLGRVKPVRPEELPKKPADRKTGSIGYFRRRGRS
jgi:ATP-dependent RNA helicase RhlE